MKAHTDKRAKAARAANLMGLTRIPGMDSVPRAERDSIDPAKYPRKHAPGSLTEGMSVWYRNERWWVERAPKHWAESCHIRITDKRPLPGKEATHQRTTFYVHADCVDIAPVKGHLYDKQTTMAQEAAKERAKSGQHDVGDEAATMLRGKSLDEAYTIAARFLRVPEDELRTKYGHLNNGQQRMCLGNKIRFAIKKGEK